MKRRKQFAICVRNKGAEDLEVRKVYELLPDARAVTRRPGIRVLAAAKAGGSIALPLTAAAVEY